MRTLAAALVLVAVSGCTQGTSPMDEYEQALNIYTQELLQYNRMLADPVHYGLDPGDIPEKQRSHMRRAADQLTDKRNAAFD